MFKIKEFLYKKEYNKVYSFETKRIDIADLPL